MKLLSYHSTPWRWAVAVVAFAAALFTRMAPHEDLPPDYPFLTFFPVEILTAFVAGLIPGVAVAFAASWYSFTPPVQTFDIYPPTALALTFFATVITVDLLVIHFMFEWMAELDDERRRSAELATSRGPDVPGDPAPGFEQHRVVGASIRVQRRNVSDPEAARVLDEAANRLTLIGKIQRSLHDPKGRAWRSERS